MENYRTKKPVPAEEFAFIIPKIQRFRLENGITVYFVERHNLPIVRINIVSESGSRLDPREKKGLANMFSMMIDEGAGEYSALELSDEFELLGSNFDIKCNSDFVYFSLRTLKENFDKSLKLVSSIITQPHFNKEDFEREQRKALTRIIQLRDDPGETADTVFDYLLYGENNPYAFPVLGYEDTVRIISGNDVRSFYENYFIPGNSAVIAVGDINRPELEEKLNAALLSWKAKEPQNSELPSGFDSQRRIFVVNRKDAVQTEIRTGHLSSKRNIYDFFPKMLMNTILGGQFSSRINLNLREKRGYTYGASSNFNYYKHSGYFSVSTSAALENTAKAVSEIFNELEGIRKGITPEELEFAKSSVIRKFPSNFETNSQIASGMTRMFIHELPDNHFQTYINRLNSVILEQTNKASLNSIFPNQAVTVLAGDLEKLRAQFSPEPLIEVDEKGTPI